MTTFAWVFFGGGGRWGGMDGVRVMVVLKRGVLLY